MTDRVVLEIPSEIPHATRMTPEELRLELAVHLFQKGRLSFGKAREMSTLSIWEFLQLLGSRGIPLHYDLEDYDADLKTLRDLGRI